MTTTPAMWQLAGIYLNQDWAEEYASWREAVDAFVEDFPDEAPVCPTRSHGSSPTTSQKTTSEIHADPGFDYRPQPTTAIAGGCRRSRAGWRR